MAGECAEGLRQLGWYANGGKRLTTQKKSQREVKSIRTGEIVQKEDFLQPTDERTFWVNPRALKEPIVKTTQEEFGD